LGNGKYLHLLLHAVSRIPPETSPILSVTSVRLRKRGSLEGLVGLTKYVIAGYKIKGRGKVRSIGRHILTFYSSLLGQLSDESIVAIMAHELAHAWLNEKVKPEESQAREKEADTLAKRWGFGAELKSLASETEPVFR